jgi:long-subunit acyl-CoA synthetase (AMP-forming)
MTESSPVTHMSPIINNQIGSFGEPVSRTRVKVVDLNTGESLGPGQEGEMCVFGPQVMKGYYKNVKATEETIDSAGWLHTGDIAYYNEQNQFFIVDRLKELIKVKGLQVCLPLLTYLYGWYKYPHNIFSLFNFRYPRLN